ncbi:MAG: adenine phosphoribosyltransferase [Ruminococcus sp.]|nr:adenine phosphoribosyltransferase [Ruminococcus sp.]
MKDTYEMTIAGLKRELPVFKVNDKLSIAAFIMFGDTEITVACAEELLKKCPDFDVLLTAEAKGIPLCYEMARQSKKPYVVARKGVKVYMTDPVKFQLNSITTQNTQTLYLGQEDISLLKDKRVLIVDDVISTGESLMALEEIVKSSKGNLVCQAAVLAEGDAAERDDIIFLEKLPLFFN